MTGKSIETDEKPCPLTVGEWIALLTAESQVKSGYKNLAIMMLLMVFSITLTVYTATRFETLGSLTKLIAGVISCVIVALLIYYSKLTMNIFTEKDGNSEIIEEIVSGELTDSDEIRKRWKKHETPANAEELLKICEKQIETGWNVGKFFNLVVYSFRGNFKAIKKNIHFGTPDASETEKFINTCENRRERAKILLNEIAPVIGFDVIAMTVVATMVPKSNNGGGSELLKEILFAPFYGILIILLFVGFTFLFVMLAHYRVQVHAWTAFKEAAILRKSPAGGEAS